MLNKTRILSSADARYVAIFLLLHALLAPASKDVSVVNDGKKHTKRFTVKDSQNSFLVVKPTNSEFDSYIAQMNKIRKITHPMLIVIADNVFALHHEIFVYFHGIKFKLCNIVSAVDICFKIFALFNIEFPLASQLVWQFINLYFYDISAMKSGQGANTNVLLLIRELEQMK